MNTKKLFLENKPILMVSDGNYTEVTFSNGMTKLVSYCQTAIAARFGVKLKKVTRGVSVDPDTAKKEGNNVIIMNTVFPISKRMMKNWQLMLLVFLGLQTTVSFAQTAKNDSVYSCLRFVIIDPLKNDILTGVVSPGVRILTQPQYGTLEMQSNNLLKYGYTTGHNTDYFTYGIWNGTSVSSPATVRLFGKSVATMSGTYSSNVTIDGCRVSNIGSVTVSSSARVNIQSSQSVYLLPGTTIEAGSVTSVKIVRP